MNFRHHGKVHNMISEDESAKYMELLFEPKHELNLWNNSKPTRINLETFASS
jgi:hypothetical protein